MDYYSTLSAVGYQRLSYWHQPGKEPFVSLTLGQLVDWAAIQYGDREAMVSVYEGIRWTFKQAKEKADQLAAGLLSLGLVPGDMIALWGYNSSNHYLTALAAARAGLILAKIDPQYQAPEILHCLNKVGAKLLIAAETDPSQGYYQILHSLAPELESCAPGKLLSKQLPELATLVFTGDQRHPGAYLLDDILNMASPVGIAEVHKLQESIDCDEDAFIHYTSGTTGYPKAAVWSHHIAVNATRYFINILNPRREPVKILAQMQCCHIGSTLGVVFCSLHSGTTAVFPAPKFDPDMSIAALRAERCEISFGTPAMYVDLITRIQELGISPEYPKVAAIGGSTFSEILARQIIKVLSLERFIPLYGMTEAVPMFCSLPGDTMEQSILTTGRAATDIEFKVVDKDGKMVPMGTPGELWARGYNVMKGYWKDEAKTKETITKDGWLKTGDQVILQEDGRARIVGRIKEAIIRGSDNIYPKEVEEFFLTHPDVVDAQAFGVPDARWSEEVCVYIRPREGCSLDEQQMRSFCKGKVAEFRIPRYIRFAANFPLNLIGKVDKKKMRESFLKDQEFLKNNEDIMNSLLKSSKK